MGNARWACSIFWISWIVNFGRKFENLVVYILESCNQKGEKDEIEEEQFEGLEL